MAPARGLVARRAPAREFLLALLVAAVVVAIVLAASAAFGLTLTEPPSFDLTTDPAAGLPF